MNDFERSKWQHPSSRNRVNAEIELMELMLRTSEQPTEPPAVKRAKRGGRRKPRGVLLPMALDCPQPHKRRAVLLVADIADNVDKRTVRKRYPHASDEQVAEIMRCAHGVIDRMEQKIHELGGKF